MPCILRKCLFKSTTSFKSGQWVHCTLRCAVVLCATRPSIVSNSSWHIRILHVNAFRWFFASFTDFLFQTNWMFKNMNFTRTHLSISIVFLAFPSSSIYFVFGVFLLSFLFTLHLVFGLAPVFSCFILIFFGSSFGVSNCNVSCGRKSVANNGFYLVQSDNMEILYLQADNLPNDPCEDSSSRSLYIAWLWTDQLSLAVRSRFKFDSTSSTLTVSWGIGSASFDLLIISWMDWICK